MNNLILTLGLILLGYDIYLAVRKKRTISQWCQTFFPPVVDWFVGVGGWIGLLIWKKNCPELDIVLMVFLAGFWGHIWLANRERYEK